MTAIAVVIPARDEQRLVVRCLGSVLRSLKATGVPSVVVLVAHRCSDATAELARWVLDVDGIVMEDASPDVAGARRAGAAAALDYFDDVERQDLWLFSTDADSVVPADWAQRLLAHARHRNAVAVAGLAQLDSWHGLPPAGRRAYQELVAQGIDGDTHRHAYAANLAVRADAYLTVGGWPDVLNGEEHALLAELDAAGLRVHRPTDTVVTTSGRRQARATGGLGDLLERLAVPDEPADSLEAS